MIKCSPQVQVFHPYGLPLLPAACTNPALDCVIKIPDMILGLTEVIDPYYRTETFRGLKNKELKTYSEYRTQRLVLEAWDA